MQKTVLPCVSLVFALFTLQAAVSPSLPDGAGIGGRAPAWLAAGPWNGPAGLSLFGVDAENDIRPCEGDSVFCANFDGGFWTNWTAAPHTLGKGYVIAERPFNAAWAKSASYGALWVESAEAKTVRLVVRHGGIGTSLFVNGESVEPSGKRRLAHGVVKTKDATDQGNVIETIVARGGLESVFEIVLAKGANRLLLKIVRQDDGASPVAFDAEFSGLGDDGFSFHLKDPSCDAEKHAALGQMWAKVDVSATANLPHPGEGLFVTTAINFPWEKPRRTPKDYVPPPLPAVCPFVATVEQVVRDWDGKEVSHVAYPVSVPGTNAAPLCVAGEPGYYSIHTTIKDTDGAILFTFPADGFSVLPKADEKERQMPRKIATCFYWLNERHSSIFDWMERMGIRHNVGGDIANTALFEEAARRGISLTGDFLDPWSSANPARKRIAADAAAPYARMFKSWNEIDICPKYREDGAKWAERTKTEHGIIHAARSNAIYTGGSLVRPAVDGWFDACLSNGIYDAVDVWDVHAYPRDAPSFSDRHITNSENESGPGVEECVRRTLGRENDKFFLMGECGARCSHGMDARRWQADMTAKIAAWVIASTNYLQIAFLIPWEHRVDSPRDIPVAHYPAEAALFTVANLIDGFPAEEVPGLSANIEARRFGRTIMMWSSRGNMVVDIPAREGKKYVLVDVVGRSREVSLDESGRIRIDLTTSPVYLVAK